MARLIHRSDTDARGTQFAWTDSMQLALRSG